MKRENVTLMWMWTLLIVAVFWIGLAVLVYLLGCRSGMADNVLYCVVLIVPIAIIGLVALLGVIYCLCLFVSHRNLLVDEGLVE